MNNNRSIYLSSVSRNYIDIEYNFGKIEAYSNKENLNGTVINSLNILKTIKFNDAVLDSLIGDNKIEYKEEKFDLVQYSTPNAAFYASIAAKKEKIKVRNYHLMGIRYLGASGLMRIVLKWIEKTACKNARDMLYFICKNLGKKAHYWR